ncbi:MAG: DNA methyltransferase [Candidatus Omnitrophota bacterium]
MLTKEEAKEKIKNLIQTFKENIEQYKLVTYKEAQVRKEFIDKFFVALGWDVNNDSGFAEQYKEVVNEDAIKIGGNTKAPDYSFRIGGKRIFFVEAKKPSVKIKEDTEPSYQLRHYAWNVKIPLSILTDFEELAVYDCRIKPNTKDNASVARTLLINYEQYIEQFDSLWNIFSKEAVLRGSFDRYVESSKGKKGTSEVDSEFLKEIENWRENLAKNIALRNPHLTISELNYAVQKIIDKILFLIICEYRNVEKYERLRDIASKENIYKNLMPYFKDADGKYNSGIFDLEHDKITPSLVIDDKVLRDIISELYYPKCPYNFNILPVEILGSVYERFLGKTIRLTESHQAKVEEKPEVRKAGGVYYTPEYIVDYIVRNTVGRAIEGKTPKEIEKIRILDPACGSGTFLLRAYSYLLDYYLAFYSQNPVKYKKEIYQIRENQWFLTTEIRKKILLSNIFGVDIDPQAVELTKLSLLLKVLENETKESVNQQLKLFQERALPNLDKNIRCGNSLIDSDYFLNKNLTLVANEEMQKVNAFDWEKQFPEILERGGFEVVIGNPPYVKARDYDKDKAYYRNYLNSCQKYETLYKMWDLYIPFLEKGIKLLKQNGLIGMIVPDTIENADYALMLREWLIKNFYLYQIDFFPHSKIFITQKKVVGVKNTIIFVNKSPKRQDVRRIFHNKNYRIIDKEDTVEHNLELFKQNKNLVQIRAKTIPLGEICFTSYGLRLNSDKSDKKTVFKKSDLLSDKKTQTNTRLFTAGKNLERYYIGKSLWVEWNTERCPRLLVRPTFPELYEPNKLLLGRQTKVATLDKEKHIVDNTVIVCIPYFELIGIINNNIKKYFSNLDKPRQVLEDASRGFSLYYLLGIINSKFIKCYISVLIQNSIDMFPDDWKRLPIPIIDDHNHAKQESIISCVQQMLETQKLLHSALAEQDKRLYKQKTDLLDEQINILVYELYGLNKDEIQIIHGH